MHARLLAGIGAASGAFFLVAKIVDRGRRRTYEYRTESGLVGSFAELFEKSGHEQFVAEFSRRLESARAMGAEEQRASDEALERLGRAIEEMLL